MTGLHSELRGAALDAIPSPLFIVDPDVRIVGFNSAALPLLGDAPALALCSRGGEVLHCINASAGCGRSEACRTCVVRTSVGLSCRDGSVVRRPQRMRLVGAGGVTDVYLLVTTSRLGGTKESLAVLMLEDIGELVTLQGLVPMCMHCRRVRDEGDWGPVERYLKRRLDLDVTHGLCPECLERHYPET